MTFNKVIETEVLVVGGGMAGFFASIKAKEQGMDVTLVDKGYVGNTGQSPYAGSIGIFDEDAGDNMDEWLQYIQVAGEYLCNLDFTKADFEDSKATLNDLVSWGIEFKKDEKGNMLVLGGDDPSGHKIPPVINGKTMPQNPMKAALLYPFKSMKRLRKVTLDKGVKIMDRIMINDLITNDDNTVIGALGMTVEDAEPIIFKSKSVILCTGASSFKPFGWPISNLTSDGDAMAYKLGAAITGKEFQDPHGGMCVDAAYKGHKENPTGEHIFGKRVNDGGNTTPWRGMLFNDIDFIVHEGDGPYYMYHEKYDHPMKLTSGTTLGMGVHKAEGIWPQSIHGDTSIKGLFAAGDALGTMNLGTVYSGIGVAFMSSATTGARAGVRASKYAKTQEIEQPNIQKLENQSKEIYNALNRKSGFSPRWLIQTLHSTMVPYYILSIKDGRRLDGALAQIEFMRDHIVPRLVAHDPHELRLAIEAKNMVQNAEMKLKASLFRKESRGGHYREDYPTRNDDYLCWLTITNNNGEMQINKKPIPDEWAPDKNLSYDDKYIYKFIPEIENEEE